MLIYFLFSLCRLFLSTIRFTAGRGVVTAAVAKVIFMNRFEPFQLLLPSFLPSFHLLDSHHLLFPLIFLSSFLLASLFRTPFLPSLLHFFLLFSFLLPFFPPSILSPCLESYDYLFLCAFLQPSFISSPSIFYVQFGLISGISHIRPFFELRGWRSSKRARHAR